MLNCWIPKKNRLACLNLMLLLMMCVITGGCAHRKPPTPETVPKPREIATPSMSQSPDPGKEYTIGPLDILSITVYGISKYDTTARVGGDGTIRFPDLGLIKAGGLDERQLEDEIRSQLVKNGLVVDPQVMVFVKELHAREVSITGEVRTPGVYPLRGGEELIDLIAKAGGLMPTAGNQAIVLRKEPAPGNEASSGPLMRTKAIPVQVDLVGLLQRGDDRWNLPLRVGDRVTIPSMGWVHITGWGIQRPGTYQLRMSANMLRQVIDDAGGLKFYATNKLQLLRRTITGQQEITIIDYKKIHQDERNDIVVQGGDTVIVNSNPFKLTMYGIAIAVEKVVQFNLSAFYEIGHHNNNSNSGSSSNNVPIPTTTKGN